jgi:hypothetical protein
MTFLVEQFLYTKSGLAVLPLSLSLSLSYSYKNFTAICAICRQIKDFTAELFDV